MQCRIQQCWVDPDVGQVQALVVGQADFGEDVAAAPPDRAQSLKGGAIPIASSRQPFIEATDIDRLCTGRGPGRQLGRGGRGRLHRCGCHTALRMQHPMLIGLVRAGVHRHQPLPRLPGTSHHHLHLYRGAGIEYQRRRQRQLLDHTASDFITGANGQFHESGAGEQHRAADQVIGQPGLTRQRQPSGQHHGTGIGLLNDRTQQRMPSRYQPRLAHIGSAGRAVQPKPPPRERIRRQLHLPTTRARKHRRPIHPHPGQPRLA